MSAFAIVPMPSATTNAVAFRRAESMGISFAIVASQVFRESVWFVDASNAIADCRPVQIRYHSCA
jgi:hypothetical protein